MSYADFEAGIPGDVIRKWKAEEQAAKEDLFVALQIEETERVMNVVRPAHSRLSKMPTLEECKLWQKAKHRLKSLR